MRIAIMGTGGMGGYYGGHLAASGQDVTFIARGKHLTAMQEKGLLVTGANGDIHVNPAKATDDPGSIGPVDVVLFCVKLYGAEAAAEAIKPIIGPETMVISVMNGVDGPDRIEKIIGPGHVLGGAAYAYAKIDEPGVIRYGTDLSRLVFGEMDGTISERAIAFRDICRAADFHAEVSGNIETTLWEKFVMLTTNAGLTSITRKPAGEIYSDPDLKAVAVDLMKEVVTVAEAKGIELPSDIVERCIAITESFPPGMYASMYHDLAAGRPMEVQSFSGLIAKLGDELGVPVPHHQTIYACLKPYMNGTGA